MQAPQSMQESGSTTALPPAMLIALLGHSSTQVSHPVHFALSTSAGIQLPFQIRNHESHRKVRNNNASSRKYNPKFASKWRGRPLSAMSPPIVRQSSCPRLLGQIRRNGIRQIRRKVLGGPNTQGQALWQQVCESAGVSGLARACPATTPIRARAWACDPPSGPPPWREPGRWRPSRPSSPTLCRNRHLGWCPEDRRS